MLDVATPSIPPDDLTRHLTVADDDRALEHIAVVGDTYTILLSGEDTAGRFCLIDMLVPPGGGPAPHRHDFEETFTVLEGEIALTCRGETSTARAGTTFNIPANAPHAFKNVSESTVRLLCTCAPVGQEAFFREVGVLVPSRTSPAPELDDAAQAEFMRKAKALALEYRTELLGP